MTLPPPPPYRQLFEATLHTQDPEPMRAFTKALSQRTREVLVPALATLFDEVAAARVPPMVIAVMVARSVPTAILELLLERGPWSPKVLEQVAQALKLEPKDLYPKKALGQG